MTFEELAQTPMDLNPNCFFCGEAVTPRNYSGADQLTNQGTRQPICQNCRRLDDVVHLDELC